VTERTLIDAVVRQTVVLIAQLATAGGVRAPLAHVAERVFQELSRELERQGVARSVTADMFGMALRTYQRRTQRMESSVTERGRSLWEAVFAYVRDGDVVTRDEVIRRFRRDDEVALRAVLRDLTDSGLVFASGTGRRAIYRATTEEEVGNVGRRSDQASLEALVWSVVFREDPVTLARLSELVQVSAEEIQKSLDALLAEGRIERVESAGRTVYRSRALVLGLDDPAGWEASVLDHFTAVVRTIVRKLSMNQRATSKDEVGGSTYHFTLYRGHPMQEEVLGELARFRERASALRRRLQRYNEEHGIRGEALEVTAYYGQCVLENEPANEGADEGADEDAKDDE
jgi:hypothetical protein